MTGNVLALEHVTVTTPQELEQEVLEWYEQTLGLTRIDKPEGAKTGGGWFEVGAQQIHVLIDPHNPPKNAHFCIRVADFDAFVANLRSSNCHLEQARELPGRRRCFTRDPAGNSIEVVALTDGAS